LRSVFIVFLLRVAIRFWLLRMNGFGYR
jgi:hypothetical protein